jgi:RNA polymerase sigma factor (sigma-70 family)
VRTRRIENEWKLLNQLAALNPATLHVRGRGVGSAGEYFCVEMRQTAGLIRIAGVAEVRESHAMELNFPRFFPVVPIEVLLQVPVFHPNVDPDTGFVCLWTRTCPGDSVAEAITRAQRIVSWDLMNLSPDHVMQPEAANWYRSEPRSTALPCAFVPVHVSEQLNWFTTPRIPRSGYRRQRLSL